MTRNGTYLIQKKSAKLLMLESKVLNNYKIIFNTRPLCKRRYNLFLKSKIKDKRVKPVFKR